VDLRIQQRRNGVLYLLLIATGAITLALAVALDDLAPGSIWPIPIVLVPLLAVVWTARWRRFGTAPRKDRYREFVVESGQFVVPCIGSRARNVLISLTSYFIIMGTLTVRDFGASVTIVGLSLAALPAGILVLTRLRCGPWVLRLTADGISVSAVGRIRRFAWDDIAGAWVTGRLLAILRVGKRDVRLFSELVDAEWIATAILFYLRVPAARADIGTDAELAQLRARIAAAAAAGVTADPHWIGNFFRVS